MDVDLVRHVAVDLQPDAVPHRHAHTRYLHRSTLPALTFTGTSTPLNAAAT